MEDLEFSPRPRPMKDDLPLGSGKKVRVVDALSWHLKICYCFRKKRSLRD